MEENNKNESFLSGVRSMSIQIALKDGSQTQIDLSEPKALLVSKVLGLKDLRTAEQISDEKAINILRGLIDPISGINKTRDISLAKHLSFVVDEDFSVHALGVWEDDE